MYEHNIQQKHWCDGIRSMYDSTRGLVEKASDKVLLGAITLDTMFGNPSIAYTQETSENANQSSDGTWAMYTCAGLMFVTLSNTVATDKPIMRKGFGLAGVGFCLAGVIEALSK